MSSYEIMRVTVVWSNEGRKNGPGDDETVFDQAGFRPHGLAVFKGDPGQPEVTLYPWWTILRVRIGKK